MEAYTGFAEVYDLFMDNIPYEEWAEYVIGLLESNGISPKSENTTVIDLGCGTGTFTEILAKAGFLMIGIDNSEDMLVIANEKKYRDIFDNADEYNEEDTEDDEDTEEDEDTEDDDDTEEDEDNEDDETNDLQQASSTIYSLQDMCEFEVPSPVGAVVSVCDSMNYIIEEEDLVKVFRSVKAALDKDGIFLFDMKTQHFFRDVLGDETIAENREDAAFIWENYYDEDESVNEYDLAIFVQEENGLYRKYEETHIQRGYTIDQIKNALKKAELELLHIYDAFTQNLPDDKSERIYVIAR